MTYTEQTIGSWWDEEKKRAMACRAIPSMSPPLARSVVHWMQSIWESQCDDNKDGENTWVHTYFSLLCLAGRSHRSVTSSMTSREISSIFPQYFMIAVPTTLDKKLILRYVTEWIVLTHELILRNDGSILISSSAIVAHLRYWSKDFINTGLLAIDLLLWKNSRVVVITYSGCHPQWQDYWAL